MSRSRIDIDSWVIAVVFGALCALAAREPRVLVALPFCALPLVWRRPKRHPLADALRALDRKIDDAALARLSMRRKAEAAGRFREEFVAAVRHELNTPLNSILGFSEVLLNELDGPLNPQQREDVQVIRSPGKYLFELVEA